MAPSESHPTLTTPFFARAELPHTPPLARYLLSLISIKRSNLCVSADVHTTLELLHVAEEVGDYICILKTHADIIDDWSKDTIAGLQAVAARKHFLLFEDRKFGDIGNTLELQYTRGPLQIANWAHLTNAHLLPGPSIVPTLHTAAQNYLTSLNQSVSTEISAGTPPANLNDDDDESPPAIQTTEETTITSSPSSPPDTTTTTNPPTVLHTHRRNTSNSASLTTTITQSSTPLTPSQPPSLMKSLSINEEDSTTEPSSHDQHQLLLDLGPPPHARGLLLLAQMSCEGNLATEGYTEACVETARANREFVLGYICQNALNKAGGDNFLSLAPGVGLPPAGEEEGEEGERIREGKGDGKGQKWRDPKEVVGRDGIDVVIVGRGILGAEDRGMEAERYRRRAWGAYEGRIGRR